VLVGRDRELGYLRAVLDAGVGGCGATVVVRGEAGIGKSRLAHEVVAAARGRSMTVLVGRNLQHGQAPYRPLTEALFGVARAGGLPDAAELRPFRPALGSLVPDWREPGVAVEPSSVVIGEGLLRLARVLGQGSGTLLVIEDLQWADADTWAVVEYVADNIAAEPVVQLLTVRTQERSSASDLVSRLEARRAARVVDLGRLGSAEVAAMVAATSAAAGVDVAAEVVEAVDERSEGLPLLVEELLSVPGSGVSRAVPTSFADAVARRLAALPVEAVLVVECAAVLGRRFDWRLLPAVTALDEDSVRRGLSDAVAVQLLSADEDGRIRFRHALTRDAVLAGLLAPTRIALARRAAQALGRIDEGGDRDRGTWALLAADLWCAAGEPDSAARGLLETASRATVAGRLVTAERLLERARSLDVTEAGVRAAVGEALAEVLALAAKVDEALSVGAEALALLEVTDAPVTRHARVHLAMARAVDAAGRWPLAEHHLQRARRLGRVVADECLLTAVNALAAHVAMGEFRYDDAERLAAAAAGDAARLRLPDIECEALEVLGRRERLRDLDRAQDIFTRAHGLARAHGLVLWSMRTLHELGTIDMLLRADPGRLRQASDAAYRAGALSLAATVDLQLVGLHTFLFEVDDAIEVGTRAIDVARALGLAEVHAATLLQIGLAHAIAGRRSAMEEAVAAALAIVGDNPEALAVAWGQDRAVASLLAEDRLRALEELEIGVGWAGRVRGVTGVFTALSALLRVVEGDGEEAITVVEDLAAQAAPVNRAIIDLARAVLDARAGDHQQAEMRVVAADAVLRALRADGWRHLSFRILAEPALAGGWGDPLRWLTDALAFFQDCGQDRVAAACRDLLRRAGHPWPRPLAAGVPEPLHAAGVTGREMDVLGLLGERLSNREIAGRLYLSPRTVEKHIERLLRKTRVSDRSELGRLARRVRGVPPTDT
jgi:DNA-binding CsgD family transcriptional regulator/tetratricopeptide (TPR) repeat protein